jgi:hypothetical protein
MRMRIATGAAFLLMASATSCSRTPRSQPLFVDAGADAQPLDDATPLDAATDAARPIEPVDEPPPATYVGARRARLAKLDDEPGLAKNAAAIRAHFDGGLPPSMDLQAVPLGAGKEALLLSAASGDPRPITLLVDAQGAPLWTKERPLGGLTPPAKPFAMAPRPDEGLALFFYDEPTKLVGARMWAADGAAFAEIVLFDLARCDAISATWWPAHGWIVVASFPGGAHAQLLGEGGSPAWERAGLAVGESWRAPAPATIVIDPETSSWLLFQHATRSGADHVVAIRYGALGERLGDAAIDFGAVGRAARTSDRIEASLVRPGIARVDVGGKVVERRIGAL